MFVTAVFGKVNTRTGDVTFVNAGHEISGKAHILKSIKCGRSRTAHRERGGII